MSLQPQCISAAARSGPILTQDACSSHMRLGVVLQCLAARCRALPGWDPCLCDQGADAARATVALVHLVHLQGILPQKIGTWMLSM